MNEHPALDAGSWVRLFLVFTEPCKSTNTPTAEMEKAADAADMSVLFFSAGANF